MYSDRTLRVQGGCLDVVSAGTTSGTNVDWYPRNGTPAQNWTHQANGELVNPSSGLCLTDPGGNTGARLDIETCTDSAQQQWSTPSGSGGGGGGGGGTCGTTNFAQGKAATASSTESATFPASNAVDGNAGTRWSSAFSDPQWLEVDLGSLPAPGGTFACTARLAPPSTATASGNSRSAAPDRWPRAGRAG